MTIDNQTLEDILDTCLDRLQRGDSIQACLEEYPEYADELAPMLETAEMLQPREVVPPVMSMKAYQRNANLLLDRASELRAGNAQRDGGQSTGLLGALGSLLWGPSRRLALTAIAMVLLLAVVGTGTVAASNDSLPGSALYPVKRTAETVWATLPRSPDAQTQVHLELAERRLQETERLLAEGRINDEVVGDMERELARARESANAAGDDALRRVLAQTKEYTDVLNRLQAGAPAGTLEEVQQLLSATERISEQVQEDLGDDVPDSDVPSDDAPTPGDDNDAPGKVITPKPTRTPRATVKPDEEPTKELPTDGRQRRRGTPTPRPDAEGPGNPPATPPGQDDEPGPPDETPGGPPPDTGPPDDAGPPENGGSPPDTGPPDDAGPPPGAGPPDNGGPPDDAGPPDNPGGGNDDDDEDDEDDDDDGNNRGGRGRN